MTEPLLSATATHEQMVELAETPVIIEFVHFLREDPRLQNARDASLLVNVPAGGELKFLPNGQVSIAFPVPGGLRTGFLNRPGSTTEIDLEVLEGVPVQWINEAASSIVKQLNRSVLELGSAGYGLRVMTQVPKN